MGKDGAIGYDAPLPNEVIRTPMTDWQSHLKQHNAVFDLAAPAIDVAGLNNPPQPSGTWLVDLAHLGSITVSGEEAIAFLGGQFTNDVRALSADRSQLNGWCNPQGRLLALFRVTRHGDTIVLQLPRALAEPMLKRLRMFVLRAKVTLADSTADWARFGVMGDTAGAVLQNVFSAVPMTVDGVSHERDVAIIRAPGTAPRWEIVGPLAAAQTVWNALAPHARVAPSSLWRLHDIAAGQPQVYAETSGAFIPQMVNLQAIGGVNFKKGCYPGQEIVARMQYLGKLKRRMTGAECALPTPPAPGADIIVAGTPEQKVGQVVAAEMIAPQRVALLAVIELSAATQPLALAATGAALTVTALPYDPASTTQTATAS